MLPPPPPHPALQTHPPASARGSNPRNSSGIRLRPISDLPDIFRGIFKFGVFNAVQSSCFDTVFQSEENMVISAPTGSGKTVLFELAIIRALKEAKASGKSIKCVYMAPTKALCSERHRDWASKFDPLGFKCCELTGDTVVFGKGAWGDAKNANIIVTTGEKWDSLTRHWGDHDTVLSQIQLFLVDEVHILNESRGSTLEVVISRMKTRGSAVRFVLVSATVPNIDDIAAWIGNSQRDAAAKVFEFGEQFRPCKLTRHVIGVARQKNENDFSFARKLDFKLFGALQTYSVGKPILVFVSTRKGVSNTAEQLLKDYNEAQKAKQRLPWAHPPRIDKIFHEKRLIDFVSSGIGIHHAGMTIDDRRAVEDLYLKGTLRVVVATSTLAVGVNLPAHTVVIKGVQTFQNNQSVEYSDLDIMQMIGRAGRPQFDKDGLTIILCETELENKYRELAQGTTIVESSLHTNLSEHLNSEIGLGTITTIRGAKEWLRGSFLFQRVRKNPAHYALGKGENQTWEERVDDMVTHSVDKLRETRLIAPPKEGDKSGLLKSTEFGDIMSKFYIKQSTMSAILALPEKPTLREVLEVICASEELAENKLRTSEKTVYNKLRRHNDIRFEVKKVERTSDKVLLLIQAILGGISLNTAEYKTSDSQPHLEAYTVFKHVCRIARVVVEVAVVQKRGAQLKHGLEMVRCLTAKAWDDRPVVLKQVESIGDKSIKVLAENGITSLFQLGQQEPHRIELLLNRRPPFGHEIISSVRELPHYMLEVQQQEHRSNGGQDPVEVDLCITCGLAQELEMPNKAKKTARGKYTNNMTDILTLTSDLELIDFRRIQTRGLKENRTFEITAELTKPSQSILVLITAEFAAGLTVTEILKPKIAAKEYPIRDTRPLTALELDLEGLEDSDFWNLDSQVDRYGNEVPEVVRDLTKPRERAEKPAAVELPKSTNKLSNGNFPCNHACKDKTKCRHLCCREGLAEPPKQPRKRTDEAPPGENNKPMMSKLPSKAKAKPSKTLVMQDLERIHERSNVSLKMPEGSRLKLASPPKAEPSNLGSKKRKRKAVINFNVELSELEHAPAVSRGDELAADLEDELPDPSEFGKTLRRQQQQKAVKGPSPDYSDSDIDSLIRNAPSELVTARDLTEGEKTRKSAMNDKKRTTDGPDRPLKRARFDLAPSPTKPLFYEEEDLEYDQLMYDDDDDEAIPNTPGLSTGPSEPEEEEDQDSTGMSYIPEIVAICEDEDAKMEDDDDDDDLAALEAWLA
ncbi:unnamed protein product [Mycena citricolor]|uniref:DNA 3'-5' helicase n=1 Tax=Mycena citricolor TaxID=2018698 RepID=A0AAD2Q5V7_9AGAR|nr:unnamed protein product [Mycena citricolor]